MSGYILCQTKKAKIPYYIENISTNVYSLEELCYYFYHNLYLIDESILNERLCRWLQEELELSKLAAKLRPLFERNYSIEEFLYPVFKEINYLTYEEMKSLNMQIQKLAEEAPFLREKRSRFIRNFWKKKHWKRSGKELRRISSTIWDVPTATCSRWKKRSNVSAGRMRAAGVRMH